VIPCSLVDTNILNDTAAPIFRINEDVGKYEATRHNILQDSNLHEDSKGFWHWCTALRVTGFTDFAHHPEF
jgi:hypothetical protein